MTINRSTAAVVAAFTVALTALAAVTPAHAAERMAAAPIKVVLGPAPIAPTFIEPELPAVPQPEAVAFTVTYTGFTAAARAAFQRAVNIWSAQLTSSVPVTVSARFQPLPFPVLGSAGSSFLFRNFSGAPRADTWYVDALANKRAGRQLDPSPDIVATFSSSFTNWHFGTGPAPAGRIDFTSVVLHELGHGLGFSGGARVSGGLGSLRLLASPYAYSRFTENTAGTPLLAFGDPSPALATQLTSNGLWFDSPLVRTVNGGLRARLYAPAVFAPGSSYSHLDEATFPAGNPNSLMTPAIGTGETIRSPGRITLAIFTSTGW
jgi:hypothetical protein